LLFPSNLAKLIYMNPTEAIEAGRKFLDPVMTPAGFQFVAGILGHSSGGNFARH
jgi:hypothetical protein